MNEVIKIENLSKTYKISHLKKPSGSLREDIVSFAKKPLSLILGQQQEKDEIWALKDVNISIEQGEIVGLIGKNGSGKSTLLKILSRIVTPTSGQATLKGRVASLLEVGTGFHPDLSGKENIFLNGAVLGMKQHEIVKRFDEIVEFSGVGHYLDTPVKYYSSGMYVRLAFSVAAHLESDILLLDEVLAVGDQDFQKKSLGKMQKVASEGRTVLFVSHSMDMVSTLCEKSILLDTGKVAKYGPTEEVIDFYFGVVNKPRAEYTIPDSPEKKAAILSIKVSDSTGAAVTAIKQNTDFKVAIKARIKEALPSTFFAITVTSPRGEKVLLTADSDTKNELAEKLPGLYTATVNFPKNILAPGFYYMNVFIESPKIEVIDTIKELPLEITAADDDIRTNYYNGRALGYIGTKIPWEVAKTADI